MPNNSRCQLSTTTLYSYYIRDQQFPCHQTFVMSTLKLMTRGATLGLLPKPSSAGPKQTALWQKAGTASLVSVEMSWLRAAPVLPLVEPITHCLSVVVTAIPAWLMVSKSWVCVPLETAWEERVLMCWLALEDSSCIISTLHTKVLSQVSV